VGDTAQLVLRIGAEGWPSPTYQWYKVSTAHIATHASQCSSACANVPFLTARSVSV
jgi:hypothetical protein